MQHYVFRSTTEKLAEHLQHITESGDTVVDQVFVGGRDWVLLGRKGDTGEDLNVAIDRLNETLRRLGKLLESLEQRIEDATTRGSRAGRKVRGQS